MLIQIIYNNWSEKIKGTNWREDEFNFQNSYKCDLVQQVLIALFINAYALKRTFFKLGTNKEIRWSQFLK